MQLTKEELHAVDYATRQMMGKRRKEVAKGHPDAADKLMVLISADRKIKEELKKYDD